MLNLLSKQCDFIEAVLGDLILRNCAIIDKLTMRKIKNASSILFLLPKTSTYCVFYCFPKFFDDFTQVSIVFQLLYRPTPPRAAPPHPALPSPSTHLNCDYPVPEAP